MANRLYLQLKVGDQVPDLSQKQIGMKDGMIMDYIECEDDSCFSDHTKKVFAIVEVSTDWKPTVIDFLESINTDDNNSTSSSDYRFRKGCIALSAIEEQSGISGLEDDFRGSTVVDIVDLTSITDPMTMIGFSSAIDVNVIVPDNNSITSGSFTIGTSGDYLTTVAAGSDSANQNADLTFRYISNVTETAQASFTHDVSAGNVLTLSSDSPHNGNANGGYEISINHSSNGLYFGAASIDGFTHVHSFKVKRLVNGSVTTRGHIFANSINDISVHDIFGDGNDLDGTIFRLSNNQTSGYNLIGRDGTTGVMMDANNIILETSLLEGCTTGVDGLTKIGKVRNVASVNNTTDFTNTSQLDALDNSSSDATADDSNWLTGSGNNINIVAGNEYNLDDSADTYGRPKGSVKKSATIPTLSMTDMNGVLWTSEPAVGAKEFKTTGGIDVSATFNGKDARITGIESQNVVYIDNENNLKAERFVFDNASGGIKTLATSATVN